MAYKVVWLRESYAIGTEQFEHLDEAKDRAKNFLHQMNANFKVTAVKVVDDHGSALFLDSCAGR